MTQFFPIFLPGALFGKLMEARGSVESIAKYMPEKLGCPSSKPHCHLPAEWPIAIEIVPRNRRPRF